MASEPQVNEVSRLLSRTPQSLTVLLVEDNPVDARFISGMFKGSPITIRCEHVGRLSEALHLLKSTLFDIILLDLNLEDSQGHDTFSHILAAAPSTAILVLSASDDEELAVRTVREGAQDYLVKGSFDRRLLMRSIHYAYERKHSEEALRHSEATVRAIFENSLDGIVITEDRGFCLEANSAAAALAGLARDELMGRNLMDFFGKEQESEWLKLRSQGNGRARFWIRRDDGVRRLLDCGFNANILPGRHLLVLHDITDQQNLEEQLRQSQKMEAVGRLAGGVAHDFNNILGIITGYAELLQLHAGDDNLKSKADKIMSATEKAASLTRQLLAFGRKQFMSPRLLNLAEVMTEMTTMVEIMVGAEIQVVVRADRNAGVIHADQSQLEQVIMNLAANARDSIRNGGVLGIRIEGYSNRTPPAEVPPGDYLLLSVRDTGVGMDPEIQARIFEPFFTTKTGGNGLGLATVYGIVKQSGGHITVHSEPGSGTTFNIYLPVVPGDPVAKPAPRPPERIDLPGTETILLVDDEDDLRNATAEYLKMCGYNVLKASNGLEAIEMADQFKGKIALVISDIVMPKVSGRGLVDHIRKTRPETRVLVISGYADDDAVRHGIFLETTGFLQKPYSFQVLGSKVRTLLDERVQ